MSVKQDFVPEVSLIAAIARNGAIGYQNRLLYTLPNDMKRFKALTSGHTVVMGRKTFESLPKGALPHRRNIVLTHNTAFVAPDVEVFASLETALRACHPEEKVFIIGGASVYAEALPYASRLCLTLVDDDPAMADTFFPSFDKQVWHAISDEPHTPDERHAFAYRFVDYIRITSPYNYHEHQI